MNRIEREILSLFLVFAMVISLFPKSFAFAQTDGVKDSAADKIDCSDMLIKSNMAFAGGDGTKDNPYQISTAAQLNAMRNNLSAHYILTEDIDLSKFGAWTPVGTDDAPFSGALDGQNHKITGLTINNDSVAAWVASNTGKVNNVSVGLFGTVSSETKFSNLTFENYNVNIDSCNYTLRSGAVIGAMASVNTYNISIINCSVNGSVTVSIGDKYGAFAGGIIGYETGDYMSIQNCTNNATFFTDSGGSDCGGIAGYLNIHECISCINTGAITGVTENSFGSTGGIAGNAEYSHLTNCVNHGTVSAEVKKYSVWSTDAENSMAGGISGFVGNEIKACDNYGNVSADIQTDGSSSAGGICGHQSHCTDGAIDSCKNYGESITATYHVCKDEKNKIWEKRNGYAARICGYGEYVDTGYLKNNDSLGSTTVNGSIPSENIGADKINGATLSSSDQPGGASQWSGWGLVAGNTDKQMTIGDKTYLFALTEPLILITDSYKNQYVAYQLNDRNQITQFQALKEMTGKLQGWDNTARTLAIGDGLNKANYKPYNESNLSFQNFLAAKDTFIGKDVKFLYDETAQTGDSGLYYTLFRIEPYALSTITGKLTQVNEQQKQATVGGMVYSADGSVLNTLKNDLNQDVVCTLRNNIIQAVMKVSDVLKGPGCSLKLNSSIKYQNGKYDSDSVIGVLTVSNPVSSSFQGDLGALKNISALNVTVSKVTVESDSSLFQLNRG